MSGAVVQGSKDGDPYRLGRGKRAGASDRADATGRGEGGPASKFIVVSYGFWIFLVSDIIMFSAFFAAFAVLRSAAADGPTGAQLFDLEHTAIETGVLLASTFTCSLSSVAADFRRLLWTELALLATVLLGATFLTLEVSEFAGMIAQGAGPDRSAFLSAFFALVGLHGLHVFCGLLWAGTMMAQVLVKGYRAGIRRRLHCFNLFWHALDIIWVALFTIVYLLGVA